MLSFLAKSSAIAGAPPEVEPLLASHIWPLRPILAAFTLFLFLFSFLFIYVANRDWVIMASHMARVCGELSVSMVVSMVVSVVNSIDATPQCTDFALP